MNIPSKSISVNSAEQSYRQLNTTIQRDDAALRPEALRTGKQKPGLKQVSTPADVLSAKEVDTLRALFNKQSDSFSTYGVAKINNVQSGYLLDIRG